MGKHWNWKDIKRTLIKSVIWRVIAFVRGTFVSWCFLRDINLAVRISLVGTAVAFITYFIYELLWDKFEWGKKLDA